MHVWEEEEVASFPGPTKREEGLVHTACACAGGPTKMWGIGYYRVRYRISPVMRCLGDPAHAQAVCTRPSSLFVGPGNEATPWCALRVSCSCFSCLIEAHQFIHVSCVPACAPVTLEDQCMGLWLPSLVIKVRHLGGFCLLRLSQMYVGSA